MVTWARENKIQGSVWGVLCLSSICEWALARNRDVYITPDLYITTSILLQPPGMCPIVCNLKKTKTKHCQTTVLNGYNKWILTTWESIQVCGSQGIFISVHKDRRVLAGLAYAFRSLAITTYSCWNNQPASGSDLDPFFKNRWTDKNVLNQLQWSNSVSEWRANDVGQTGNKKGAKAKVNGGVY